MEKKYFADYHIHTEFSDDSTEPMEKVVQHAIALGMDEICFTEHVDYGVHFDRDTEEAKQPNAILNVDYPCYFERIQSLREKYEQEIIIKQGMEFGMQTHTKDMFQKLFDQWEFDFIILSNHQVGDKEFHNYDYQQGKHPDEYNHDYYQAIYDCMSIYSDYCVLGHLDMIQRHNEPRHPFEKSKEIIQTILEKAIADGKGIEINTSSFRYQLPDLTPERKILELYYELGGNILTLGSDAHTARRLGEEFPYVKKVLKEIGFQEFCTFDRMKPIFHEL
jgi:histidinol-phosphatase (PHP family)